MALNPLFGDVALEPREISLAVRATFSPLFDYQLLRPAEDEWLNFRAPFYLFFLRSKLINRFVPTFASDRGVLFPGDIFSKLNNISIHDRREFSSKIIIRR